MLFEPSSQAQQMMWSHCTKVTRENTRGKAGRLHTQSAHICEYRTYAYEGRRTNKLSQGINDRLQLEELGVGSILFLVHSERSSTQYHYYDHMETTKLCSR